MPLLSAFATPVLAQTCNPSQTASHLVGDDYYMCGGPGYAGWDCNPSLRSQFWDRYGFEFDSWSGRGYYEPCDNSQKLAQATILATEKRAAKSRGTTAVQLLAMTRERIAIRLRFLERTMFHLARLNR